jgi:hypothetical protein
MKMKTKHCAFPGCNRTSAADEFHHIAPRPDWIAAWEREHGDPLLQATEGYLCDIHFDQAARRAEAAKRTRRTRQ